MTHQQKIQESSSPNNKKYDTNKTLFCIIAFFAVGVGGGIFGGHIYNTRIFKKSDYASNTAPQALPIQTQKPAENPLNTRQKINDATRKNNVEIFQSKRNRNEKIPLIYTPEEKIGMGFSLTSDGWIITSSTIFEQKNFKELLISTHDNPEPIPINTPPIIDKQTQTAYIKIAARNMPVVPLVEMVDISPGMPVYIIEGATSIIHTSIRSTGDAIMPSLIIESADTPTQFININSEIKSSTIGSGVINEHGELIGIVTSITKDETAIITPIHLIKPKLKNIFTNKAVSSFYTGINFIDLSKHRVSGIRQAFGALIFGDSNKKINGVQPKSPAEKSGLKEGDIIIAIEDENIQSPNTIYSLLHQYPSDRAINLTILRSGEKKEITITPTKAQ